MRLFSKINTKKPIKPSVNKFNRDLFIFFVICAFLTSVNFTPLLAKEIVAKSSMTKAELPNHRKYLDGILDWKEKNANLGERIELALKNQDISQKNRNILRRILENLYDARFGDVPKFAYSSNFNKLVSEFSKPKGKKTEVVYTDEIEQNLAELRQAEYILSNEDIFEDTLVVVGADDKSEQFTDLANLPKIDIPGLEADVYYRDKQGTLHLNEVKNTFNALKNKLEAESKGGSPQFQRFSEWVNTGSNREVLVIIRDSDKEFYRLLDEKYINLLAKCVKASLNKYILQVDNRTFSINQLRELSRDTRKKMNELIEETKKEPKAIIAEYFNSVEQTFETLEKEYGDEIIEEDDNL